MNPSARREIRFSEKGAALRDDVHTLGALVGEVIREQGGETLFQRVETARIAAIRRREEGEVGAGDAELEAAVGGLGPRDVAELVHGFAAYFDVVNLAERVHRVRRRRDYLRAEGTGAAPEERALLGRIREEITVAWQTEPHPGRPTVLDELEHVLFFLADVVYRVVPPLYEELADALAHVYGPAGAGIAVPPVLRFGSWVGGDMDGNPNVSADTIRAALARHRVLALERYQREALQLSQRLTQTLSRVGVDDAVIQRGAEYATRFPAASDAVPPRYRDMPYRVLLRLVAARLTATQRD